MNKQKKVEVSLDGPYLVSGSVPLEEEQIVVDKEGTPLKWKFCQKYKTQGKYKLCRCGYSEDKPFCDGSHLENNFDGTETAENLSYNEQAEKINGPELVLQDCRKLCSVAKFCIRAGGIWDLTEKSNDKKAKKIALEEAGNCPSGRLVLKNRRNGRLFEPKFCQSISVTKDNNNMPGPLWVKGGIPIKSIKGETYEIRNRVTLCRCSHSQNKPFCDGSHRKN